MEKIRKPEIMPRSKLNLLKRMVVIPEIREKNKKIGNFYYLDISHIENEKLYSERSDILF